MDLCQPIVFICDLLDSGSGLRVRDGYNKGAGMELPGKCLSRASKTWDGVKPVAGYVLL